MKRNPFFSFVLFASVCLFSCQKEAATPVPDTDPDPVIQVEPRIVSAEQKTQEINSTLEVVKYIVDAKANNDIATIMESIQEGGRPVGY